MPVVEEEEDCDSLRAHLHSNPRDERGRGKGKGKLRETSSTEEESQCDLLEDESTDSSEHRSCNRAHHRRREPLNLNVPKRTAPSPAVDSPKLPHCRTRNLGSSERRAQRKSSGQFDEDHCRCSAKIEPPREYQAPYVEEATSAPQSRRGTPSPAVPSANSSRKGEASNNTNEHRDTGLAAKHSNERPRSSASSKQAKCNCADHEPAEQWDKNVESDLSADSRKSSLKSSSSGGSKTVRFKQSVDIRTPISPVPKHEPSSVDNRHMDMEGDDGAGPSQSRGSPLLPHHEIPPSANFRDGKRPGSHHLDPDSGRSTSNRPESYRSAFRGPSSVPRNTPSPGFSQGAFGKSFGSATREWEGFSSYEDSPNGFGASFGNSSARMNGFTGKSPRAPRGAGFAETPKSQASFRTSGFGSFFNKNGKGKAPSGDKRAGHSPPMASSPDSYGFQETARDH